MKRLEQFWPRQDFRSRHAWLIWLITDSLDRAEQPAENPDQLALDLEIPEGTR